MTTKWYIISPDGDRWNALHQSFGFWIWGTDYLSREAAEADALMLTIKYPVYLGRISVSEAF